MPTSRPMTLRSTAGATSQAIQTVMPRCRQRTGHVAEAKREGDHHDRGGDGGDGAAGQGLAGRRERRLSRDDRDGSSAHCVSLAQMPVIVPTMRT
jgi:hypothetical protein